jgi:putative flippase GtrA
MSAFIDILLSFFLIIKLDFSLNIGLSISFFVSAMFNYLANKNLIFKSKVSHFKSLFRYLCLLCVNYILTLIMINYLIYYYNLDLIFSKFFTICLLFIFSFFLNKHFVFK